MAGVEHGFLFHNGVYQTITPPRVTDPTQSSRVWGINDHGDLVGRWVDLNSDTHGWSIADGVYSDVDFPGNFGFSSAVAINNHGTIAGAYDTFEKGAGGPNHGLPPNHLQHGFILIPNCVGAHAESADGDRRGYQGCTQEGGYLSFDVPDATFTAALAITNHGVVAGRFDSGGANARHGFILDIDGTFTTVDEPNGPLQSIIFGLNDRHEFVGWYQVAVGQVQHGYVFSRNRFTTIDIDGAGNTLAHQIMNPVRRGHRHEGLPIVGEFRSLADNNIYGFLLTNWVHPD